MTRLPANVDELRGRRAARWIRESTAGQFDHYGPDVQRDQQDRAIARLGLKVSDADGLVTSAALPFDITLGDFVVVLESIYGADATEAYVVDVPRPLKVVLPDYQRIEDATWRAIAQRFGLDLELPAEVRLADTRILLNERAVLMPRSERWLIDDLPISPLDVTVTGWSPRDAEEFYLQRLEELYPR